MVPNQFSYNGRPWTVLYPMDAHSHRHFHYWGSLVWKRNVPWSVQHGDPEHSALHEQVHFHRGIKQHDHGFEFQHYKLGAAFYCQRLGRHNGLR